MPHWQPRKRCVLPDAALVDRLELVDGQEVPQAGEQEKRRRKILFLGAGLRWLSK